MSEDLANAAKAAAEAVSGPDKPEAVKVSQRDDRLTLLMRNLAGPALCAMIAAIVLLLSVGATPHWKLWTPITETVRAHYVGGIGVALSLMVGLLIWKLVGGRPSRIEIKAGPGSVLIEGDGGDARKPPAA